jgi:hypothetical protein
MNKTKYYDRLREKLFNEKVKNIKDEIKTTDIQTPKQIHNNIKFILERYNFDIAFVNSLKQKWNKLEEMSGNHSMRDYLKLEKELNQQIINLNTEHGIKRDELLEKHLKNMKLQDEKKAEREKKLEEQKEVKDPTIVYTYSLGKDVINDEELTIQEFIEANLEANPNEKIIVFKVLSDDFNDKKSRHYLYTNTNLKHLNKIVDPVVYPCNIANNDEFDNNGEGNIQHYIPLINLNNICGDVNACIYMSDYDKLRNIQKMKYENVLYIIIIPDKYNTVPTVSKIEHKLMASSLHCNAGGEPVQIWEVINPTKIITSVIDNVYTNIAGGKKQNKKRQNKTNKKKNKKHNKSKKHNNKRK